MVVIGDQRIDPNDPMKNRHAISHVVVHEKFDKTNRSYDTMLLRLQTSANFDEDMSAICKDPTPPTPEMKCYVTEWTQCDDRSYL